MTTLADTSPTLDELARSLLALRGSSETEGDAAEARRRFISELEAVADPSKGLDAALIVMRKIDLAAADADDLLADIVQALARHAASRKKLLRTLANRGADLSQFHRLSEVIAAVEAPPAKPPPAADLAARRLIALLKSRPDLAARALRVLAAVATRAPFEIGVGAHSVLPDLFEAICSGKAQMRRTARNLASAGLGADHEALVDAQYAFVRGCLRLFNGETAASVEDFQAAQHLDAQPRSALISRLIIHARRQAGASQARIAANDLRVPPLDAAEAANRVPSLVLIDKPGADLSDKAALLFGTGTAEIIAGFSPEALPKPLQEAPVRWPFAEYWYGAEGRKFFSELYGLAAEPTRSLCRDEMRLGEPFITPTRMLVLDDFYQPAFCLDALNKRLADTSGHVRVVVASADEDFVSAVADLAQFHRQPPAVKRLLATERPSQANGETVSWPPQSKFNRRLELVSVRRDASATAIATMRASGPAPALIVGSLKKRWSHDALVNLAGECLLKRGVVVIAAERSKGLGYSALKRRLAEVSRRSGHPYTIVALEHVMSDSVAPPPMPARDAVPHTTDGSLGAGGMESVMRRYISERLGKIDAGNVTALANWLDPVLSERKPAFGLLIGLRSRGVKTIDAHIFYHGGSARQIPTATDYLGVIDSEQEDFIVGTWKVPREHVVRVGYVWQSARALKPAGVPEAVRQFVAGREVMLVATQPGTDQQNGDMLRVVAAVARAMPTAGIILKLHPVEKQRARAVYEDVLRAEGLAGRFVTVLNETTANEMFQFSRVVVTRTSNVGLEAAAAGCAVLRCVYHEGYLPEPLLAAPFAVNAWSKDEAQAKLGELMASEPARQALAEEQRRFLDANPSLVDCGGAARLVAFIEEKALTGQ